MRILTNTALLAHCFPKFDYPNPVYAFTSSQPEPFDLEHYYAPVERNDQIEIRDCSLTNAAAIALYPLLRYMGFREAYVLGMDMSMLGSMEYAAPYTFKSMGHFRWFFTRSAHVFNPAYRLNRPFYFRPRQEFSELRQILAHPALRVTRVYDPFKYAAPVEGIPTVSLNEFLRS